MNAIKGRLFVGGTVLAAVLAGCASTPVAGPNPADTVPLETTTVLGAVELGLAPAVPAVEVSTPVASFRFETLSDLQSGFFKARFLSATFRVTNRTARTLRNLTLYAVNRTGNAGGTAFKTVSAPDGSSIADPSVAQRLRPTHGMIADAAGPVPRGDQADLQVFTVAESNKVAQLARDKGIIGAGETVLGYGYLARGLDSKRPLPAGAQGTVTVGVAVPDELRPVPARLSMTFVLVEEPVRRVTRSLEDDEDARGPLVRAAFLEAKEVALFGPTTESTVTRVRAAGFTPVLLDQPVRFAGPAVPLPAP